MVYYLIVLLGSTNNLILVDRVKSALDFAFLHNDTKIDWFLSGGFKNPNIKISEAKQMKMILESYEKPWNYILDEKSTNTAQNLVAFTKFLNNNYNYSDIYIVTSKFHFNRTYKILHSISNITVNWILGEVSNSDSYEMEKIFMNNKRL